MKTLIEPADLSFFASVGGSGSLSAAARELGVTTAAVSKHLSQMEQRIGTLLLHRTSRRMSLTPEGELYLDHARKILGQTGELEHQLGMAMATPTGLVRVNATLGFGRTHIAPLISRYTAKHPSVEVQLQLSVNPPPVTEDAFDACIRFGEPPDARVIATKLASNRRMLCASPVYLKKHGLPKTPADLMNHNCIGIRQGSEAYGLWRLRTTKPDGQEQAIKTRGNLSTNDGEIAVKWALDGHGILMRAEWDIQRYLRSGRLVPVLPQYATPNADIYVVYPEHHRSTSRVQSFVDFVVKEFKKGQ